ncbi:MAG: ribosome recycling factor [Elusimicrobia bacterium]|nr:ribosome recycling factor [Elusimicrobiota bacterium]
MNDNINQAISNLEKDMAAQVEKLKKDLVTMRTGRANPQILENVKVEYYGTLAPLKQVGAVSAPDAHTLEIQPWDPTALTAIEKALQKADMGASPVNDGKLVRISLPPMTEERRKQLVKTIKQMSEEYKVHVRNERRDAIEKMKKSEKLKEISEDEEERLEQNIQKLTDTYTKKIDLVVAEKEKEVMTV